MQTAALEGVWPFAWCWCSLADYLLVLQMSKIEPEFLKCPPRFNYTPPCAAHALRRRTENQLSQEGEPLAAEQPSARRKTQSRRQQLRTLTMCLQREGDALTPSLLEVQSQRGTLHHGTNHKAEGSSACLDLKELASVSMHRAKRRLRRLETWPRRDRVCFATPKTRIASRRTSEADTPRKCLTRFLEIHH